MFRRILIVLTVIAVLGTSAIIYFGGRVDDGTFVDMNKCSDGSDYYRQNEFECDTLRFVVPCLIGPLWLVLTVIWFFVWLGQKTNKEPFSIH